MATVANSKRQLPTPGQPTPLVTAAAHLLDISDTKILPYSRLLHRRLQFADLIHISLDFDLSWPKSKPPSATGSDGITDTHISTAQSTIEAVMYLLVGLDCPPSIAPI